MGYFSTSPPQSASQRWLQSKPSEEESIVASIHQVSSLKGVLELLRHCWMCLR